MKAFLFTAAVVGFCGLLLWSITGAEKAEKTKKPADGTFDERQRLARAQSGHRAFEVLALYLVADFLLADSGRVWAQPGADAVVGACLAATVFGIEAVRRDAYFSIGESVKKRMIWLVLYGALFTANTVLCVRRGQLIENGLLTRRAIYPAVSIWYLAILAAVVVKLLRAKREDAEEGDGA